MDYEGFALTDSAINILQQVDARARDRGLIVLDAALVAPLVFWSVLRWERKLGQEALALVTGDSRALEHDIDQLLREEYQHQRSHLDMLMDSGSHPVCAPASEFRSLLEQADSQAKTLRHSYIGSEHLVLAIVLDADQRLRAVLERHTVSYEKLKDAVIALLCEPSP